METIILLHGFASSGGSTKARFLRERLAGYSQVEFHPFEFSPTPKDFEFMTVTGMIGRLRQYLLDHPRERVTLIGSSMGALVGLHYAHRFGGVGRMLLLAPALIHPAASIGEGEFKVREYNNSFLTPHFAFKKDVPLRYGYFFDGLYYVKPPPPPAPILIIHGLSDETVPIEHSRNYAGRHGQVKLIEVDSGHQLNDRLPTIWEKVQSFLLGSAQVD